MNLCKYSQASETICAAGDVFKSLSKGEENM